MIPESELSPSNIACACAVTIKDYVLLFGGFNLSNNTYSNELWKLSRSSKGLFTCSKVITENMTLPSPRCLHSGWTYSETLWIFGGCGPFSDGYLNDDGDFLQQSYLFYNNQLLNFSPSCMEWINLKCSGLIPLPLAAHASTIIRNRVFLFGGYNNVAFLDELHELNMSSLTWTQVQTDNTKPQGRLSCSLNALSPDQLLLHGCVGLPGLDQTLSDTWIMDLPSQTWIQYKVGHCRREWHTGITGINSNSIIIGGDLSYVDCYGDCKTTFHIMLGPRSLQKLAMQTLHKHFRPLPMDRLPRKLITFTWDFLK